MDTKVLVAYPPGNSCQKAVAEAIAEALADVAIDADVLAEDAVTDLAPYCAVVLGALRGSDAALEPPKLVWIEPGVQHTLPLAIFGLEPGPLDEPSRAAAHARLDHALSHMPWLDPIAVEVFSTALRDDQPCPPSPVPALDLLDWEAIRSWAHMLPGLLGLHIPVG